MSDQLQAPVHCLQNLNGDGHDETTMIFLHDETLTMNTPISSILHNHHSKNAWQSQSPEPKFPRPSPTASELKDFLGWPRQNI
jgi:hypothetical protein